MAATMNKTTRESSMAKTIALAFGALLVTTGAALAADATGTVTGVNFVNRTLTMADGKAYTWGETVKPEGLRAGIDVTVTFDVKDGKNMATAVKPAKK
jgi:Protein of unknown function (DUF1344)